MATLKSWRLPRKLRCSTTRITGLVKCLPEKSRSALREGSPVTSEYEFIDEMRLDTEKYAYGVEFMCGRLGVSRSGYFDWRSRPESATAQRRDELKLLIGKAFEMSDSTYGHRRIHAQSDRCGVAAGMELVRRLMRELDLVPRQPRPKRFNLTQAAAGLVPDLVGRDFTAAAPGEKLVGDITCIATGEGWLYLAKVIDCCTKESHRLRDGRPLSNSLDIQGDPQRITEQEDLSGRDIPHGPRQRTWTQAWTLARPPHPRGPVIHPPGGPRSARAQEK